MEKHRKISLGLAGLLLGLSLFLRLFTGFEVEKNLVMLAGTLVAGGPIFKNAIRGLKYKIISIDLLVTIAVIGALTIGEYWEGQAVTFLFVFGSYLEARTIERTRSSIKSLLDLSPVESRLIKDGEHVIVPAEDVEVGDMVLVKAGETISVDGKVRQGQAYVNQSNISGESIPVGKEELDLVYSGTKLENGYLIVEAESVGEDTSFSRVLAMVEEAQDRKAKSQKFLERFSQYYTPGIIGLSLVLYLISRDLVLALTLLVIACPGALVISVPVSIIAGIGNGAKNGILVKGGDILEDLSKIKLIAFDKTGTLTLGRPKVNRIKAYGLEEVEVLRLAAAGEKYSDHPLGKAIVNKALEEDIGVENPEDFKLELGMGVEFKLGGQVFFLGNRRLFSQRGIDLSAIEGDICLEENRGQTTVILGNQANILGLISISDPIRPESKDLIRDLKEMGIEKTIILTGDNQVVADAIGKELGVHMAYGDLLPQDKVEKIKELQGQYGPVAMVGDGVNDTPALANADLGIAIGGVGSDIAMEVADLVLVSEKIDRLAYSLKLSRLTIRNMKENIYFALLVAFSLLLGVIFKGLSLSVGMLVHELSVFLVVVNASRILKYKPDK